MLNKDNNIHYLKLLGSLEELITLYRALLQVVRHEKEILASANLDDLNENNRTKEELLLKIRAKEVQRQGETQGLALAEGLVADGIRLDDFAVHFQDECGDKLRNIQAVLKLLFERIKKINSENEVLVGSALTSINGAMNDIKDSLVENKTYQSKGEVRGGKTQSGHLVSREV